jgi:hypothetical protein
MKRVRKGEREKERDKVENLFDFPCTSNNKNHP